MRRLAVFLTFLVASLAWADKPIAITFLHSNDMHAHAEGALIQKKPYGGYARQATLIRRIRANDPNVLLLNAGDTFQGTLYFNVYEGLADLAYMNAVRYDAMCPGNHEFDRGPGTLGAFVSRAAFPMVCANLDFSKEPALRNRISATTILTVGGEKVGVVGAITPDVFDISNPGPNVVLRDLKASVQAAVDDLTRRKVNKIVLLSHVGYDEDVKLVPHLRGVDLVIGGHSHTLLGTWSVPGWPKSEGPYPTMVKDLAGVPVPIVQGWEWSKVLGRLRVQFDGNGRLAKILDAKPIAVDGTVPEDVAIASLISALQRPILALQNQPVGRTDTGLDRSTETRRESPMANVVADAMLEATSKSGAVAAFVNSGGVRSSIDSGPITYGEAISVQPFNNTITLLDLTGAELKASFEEAVADPTKLGGILNPSRGTSYRIDFSKPAGDRIAEIKIAGEPLDPAKTYRIALPSFTAAGGDAHAVLKGSKGKRTDTGLLDIDALVDYLKAHSPVPSMIEGRIVDVK